ncbi:MAG: phosphoribosylaminoimidazolesuccinocarboxamide synthase [Ignavibacteriaceae bacterium]
MIAKQNKKYLPFDEQGYQVLEYEDYFYNQKNKKTSSKGLGEKLASINSYFLDYLKGYNIPSAYVRKIDSKSLLFLKYTQFPFRIRMLNYADKRIAKIFSIKDGVQLELPIFEYHYGDSTNSLITESHLISFNICNFEELKMMNRLCSKINAIVKSFFERRDRYLVELNCLFGKFEGKIYLVDGFSPFNMKVTQILNDGKLAEQIKTDTPAQVKKYAEHLLQLTNGE